MRLLAYLLAALFSLAAVTLSDAPPANAQAQALAPPTLAPLVRRVAPAVVSIAIKGRVAMEQNPLFNDPFFRQFFGIPQGGPIEREIQAAGSGVIIDAREGLIVTNAHVVEHADQIAVTLSDGRQLMARKLGVDTSDVALIQIPAGGLSTIPMGNADALQVGDYVIAIGNPFGIGQTVTHGIISAMRRTGIGDDSRENFLQTDAAINPGNSGGALVDMNGTLVGINTMILGPSGANVGIGFAIPVNTVRRVVDELLRHRTTAHSHWR